MQPLTLIAMITAKDEHVAFVKQALEALIEPTRSETGCLSYVLHQNNVQPNHFLFYETWSSRELWQAHMNSEHIKALGEKTADKLSDITLYEMSQVG